MKTIITIALILISLISNAQLKVVPSGSVGIGTNNPIGRLHVEGGAFLTGSGNTLRILPNNPGTEIGSTTGKIDFWYTNVGFHELVAKKFNKVSDISIKQNIQPISNIHSRLMQINGVQYQIKQSDSSSTNARTTSYEEFGFIAQDVEAVFPEAVSMTSKGLLAVDYDAFVPLLVEGYKAQQLMIDSLKQQLYDLQANVTSCCNQQQSMRISNEGYSSNESAEQAALISKSIRKSKLHQNKPNPFAGQTTIEFEISEDYSTAQILMFDMQGTLKKAIPLNVNGKGEVVINGNELPAGMYLYSLLIDGVEIDTKRIILSH